MHRENDYTRARGPVSQLPRHFESTEAWHHQVHEQHIWLMLIDQSQCFQPVTCFRDDLKIFLGSQQSTESLPHYPVIIGYDNPDHLAFSRLGASSGNSAVRQVPSLGTDSIRKTPPKSVARSLIPETPLDLA